MVRRSSFEIVLAFAVGALLGLGAHFWTDRSEPAGPAVEVAGAVLERATVPAELEDLAGAAVLRVTAEGCGARRQGSATLFQGPTGDPALVTNAHVVRGATSVLVELADGTSVRVATLGLLDGRDAALLDPGPALDAGAVPVRWGGGAALADEVVVAGHPAGRLRVEPATVRSVELRQSYDETTEVLVVSATAEGGHSGGAVLDTDGAVVGLVAARDPRSGDVVAYRVEDLIGVGSRVDRSC